MFSPHLMEVCFHEKTSCFDFPLSLHRSVFRELCVKATGTASVEKLDGGNVEINGIIRGLIGCSLSCNGISNMPIIFVSLFPYGLSWSRSYLTLLVCFLLCNAGNDLLCVMQNTWLLPHVRQGKVTHFSIQTIVFEHCACF